MRKMINIALAILFLAGCSNGEKTDNKTAVPTHKLGENVYSELVVVGRLPQAVIHSRMNCDQIGKGGVKVVLTEDFNEKAIKESYADYCYGITYCPRCFDEILYKDLKTYEYANTAKSN